MKTLKVVLLLLVSSVCLFAKEKERSSSRGRLNVSKIKEAEADIAKPIEKLRVGGIFVRRLIKELKSENPVAMPKIIMKEITKKSIDLKVVTELLEKEVESEWFNEFKESIQDKRILIAGIRSNRMLKDLAADVSLLKDAYIGIKDSNKEINRKLDLLIKNK